MNSLYSAVLPEELFAGLYTVSRMEGKQLRGMGRRKCREQILPRLPIDFDRWYERKVPESIEVDTRPIAANTERLRLALAEPTKRRYQSRATEAAAGAPTFMNRTLRVSDGETVEWFDPRFDEQPDLWPLKLYAFQPLYWATAGVDPSHEKKTSLQSTFDHWIEDWMESVTIGGLRYLRGEWTPWAVSLRLLHWCRYLAWRETRGASGDADFQERFQRECYKNALFLRNHVEWDVGGNHLVENGAALVAAGVLFDEDTWIGHGTSVLTDVAEKQFLDDGCHFERSPMYHILTLTRYLTAYDLLRESNREIPPEIQKIATDATDFLRYLRPSNSRIPLLNDAVYGQALPLDDCLQYASMLGFSERSGTNPERLGNNPERLVNNQWALREANERNHSRDTSGYYWLRTAVGELLFDGGPVGPSHLPGHSHSDTLSILLWLDDQPVVTDTGTDGYVGDSNRKYARGIRGHNSVQVGETEPISLGGKYLMGPRPVPETRVVAGTESVSLCEGYYEASPYRGPEYGHHRAVHAGDDWWLIRDTISGHGGNSVRSRLHVHPEISPAIDGNGRVELPLSEREAFCYPLESSQPSITNGWYFPRFGVAKSRKVIEMYAADRDIDPLSFGYLITTDDVSEIEVETVSDSNRLSALYLDGEHYSVATSELGPHQS